MDCPPRAAARNTRPAVPARDSGDDNIVDPGDGEQQGQGILSAALLEQFTLFLLPVSAERFKLKEVKQRTVRMDDLTRTRWRQPCPVSHVPDFLGSVVTNIT